MSAGGPTTDAASTVASLAEAPAPFPWDDAMAFCLGRLRWPARDFWDATPRELAAALAGAGIAVGAGGAPSRADLAALMALFPDRSP